MPSSSDPRSLRHIEVKSFVFQAHRWWSHKCCSRKTLVVHGEDQYPLVLIPWSRYTAETLGPKIDHEVPAGACLKAYSTSTGRLLLAICVHSWKPHVFVDNAQRALLLSKTCYRLREWPFIYTQISWLAPDLKFMLMAGLALDCSSDSCAAALRKFN